MPQSAEVNQTAAETARQLGVSVRALRVYERHGLVKSSRTRAGWRVYGQDAIHDLQRVLALKSIGFTLAQIAKLLGGKAEPLDRILALQEEELLHRKQQMERALSLVRSARKRIAERKTIPLEAFVHLIRETRMRTSNRRGNSRRYGRGI